MDADEAEFLKLSPQIPLPYGFLEKSFGIKNERFLYE
jgi:hypothetical protein